LHETKSSRMFLFEASSRASLGLLLPLNTLLEKMYNFTGQ
jgi:hypothetical protein